jgi:hypothetical protein
VDVGAGLHLGCGLDRGGPGHAGLSGVESHFQRASVIDPSLLVLE